MLQRQRWCPLGTIRIGRGVDNGGRAVGAHHQRGVGGAQPAAGVRPRAYAAVASTSTAVREVPITVTDATSWAPGRCGRRRGGHRGGRCRRWRRHRCARDDRDEPARVVGSSTPIRQGGPAGSSVRQVMSPPAERQKSVSGRAARCTAARSAAQPLTTPDGSRTRRGARRRRRRSRARPPRRAPAPRRPPAGSRRRRSRPGRAGRSRSRPGTCEHRSASRSASVAAQAASRRAVAGVAATQREGGRHAHDVLDVAAGGQVASQPRLVQRALQGLRGSPRGEVAPLTMSMSALCAESVSCVRIGRAEALIAGPCRCRRVLRGRRRR